MEQKANFENPDMLNAKEDKRILKIIDKDGRFLNYLRRKDNFIFEDKQVQPQQQTVVQSDRGDYKKDSNSERREVFIKFDFKTSFSVPNKAKGFSEGRNRGDNE